ncbi:MAG: hypothetical protein HFE95_09650 [Acutalibacter sp.]|jgi:hypothetical protein|nr:hypothetical protein [Acutalibacter sp.]
MVNDMMDFSKNCTSKEGDRKEAGQRTGTAHEGASFFAGKILACCMESVFT